MPGSTQSSFNGSITIDVSIVNPTNPKTVALQIATELQYISVVENFDDTITWNLLVPVGVEAYFDNPAIGFPGEDTGPLNPTRTATSITIDWSNVDIERRGLSFHYCLYAAIVIDDVLIPVNLDPTVHNDPPT